MRSYRLQKLGQVDGIVLDEVERPEPGPTQILVKVHAASLNRRDALILDGSYPLPSRQGVVSAERRSG